MGDRDTLASIAAKFDTTPSELSKLNRLGSTFVYPGQKLWVPKKGEARATGSGSTLDAPSPDPCRDHHDSQYELPNDEKGNIHFDVTSIFYHILIHPQMSIVSINYYSHILYLWGGSGSSSSS